MGVFAMGRVPPRGFGIRENKLNNNWGGQTEETEAVFKTEANWSKA